MCLGQCFQNGSCTTELVGLFQEEPNRLRYRRYKEVEPRSFYKGDTLWEKLNDTTYKIVELHNIEVVIVSECLKDDNGVYIKDLTKSVRDQLKNPGIYSGMVIARIAGLERRGWVITDNDGKANWCGITPEGIKATALMFDKRHKMF